MYSKLTAKFPYKTLMAIPIVIAIIMLTIILINGFNMSFEFSGGMSLEIYKKLSDEEMNGLYKGLSDSNLENLKISNDGVTIKVTTTSKISSAEFISLAEKYAGKLDMNNTFIVNLNYKISRDAQQKLKDRFREEIKITANDNSTNIIVERIHMSEKEMKEILSDPNYDINLDKGNYFFQKANTYVGGVSSVLGAQLKWEMIKSFIIAVILISIVIFIAYHILVPAITILAAGFTDVVFAAGCMSVFGIELNLTTLVALIMLLGYSVDTNILLTTKVLNRKAGVSVNETIDETMKTGLTMTFTAIGAVLTMLIVSNLTTPKITVLSQLSAVILCGLFMDIFSTWLMNTGVLKWYVERKTAHGRKKKLFKFSLFHE